MSSESFYSLLWSSSGQKPYDYSREAAVALRRFSPALPAIREARDRARREGRKMRVLDLGCADGHTAEQILSPFSADVEYFGCDVYPVEATQRYMAKAGFDARVVDGGLAGMPDHWRSFDVILALSCFQYVTGIDDVFADLVRRLRSGGVLVGYFYGAGALRQVTDTYFRDAYGHRPGEPDEAAIARLEPLARLCEALRDACEGRSVQVDVEVPELGLSPGEVPLQQFLIDHVLFAWAPAEASRARIAWALAEMFLTGPQTYFSADDVDALLEANSLTGLHLISTTSGHLVVAVNP